MPPLKIILVMLEPPLPFGNAAARWFYVLYKELVARGHHVRALAAVNVAEEIPKVEKLFPAPQYDLKLYTFPVRTGLRAKLETFRRPFSYMFSDAMKADLAAAMNDGYDIVHCEQLWSGWLALDIPQRALINVHHLIWIDQENIREAKLKDRIRQGLMTRAERILIRRLKHFRSCSPRLVPEMLKVNPAAVITTVPVGIDPSLYAYISDAKRTTEPVISVIGSMKWYPTHSAAQRLMTRLWPAIKRRVPNARVQLVGWGAKSALAEYLTTPDVTVAENVPDIQPYFDNTSLMLYAPCRGSGMKIKILESLGFGVPVVTTGEGSEGLPAIDGVHMGVCEDDAGLIERAVTLLLDPAAQNRQRAAGRALVESHCGPTPTVDAIEAIYTRMLSGVQSS